jgi:glycosyltransferase involved in cell wall biosynthesis
VKNYALSNQSDDNGRSLTIVYLGGFYPWQGVSLLVEAFAQARQADAFWPACLLLIGSGPQEQNYGHKLPPMDLQEDVTFTGHISLAGYSLPSGAGRYWLSRPTAGGMNSPALSC